jgi:hypothetical protein
MPSLSLGDFFKIRNLNGARGSTLHRLQMRGKLEWRPCPHFWEFLVMMVDPASRAETNNCTPVCEISEQGKITVKQPWQLRKAELLSPIPISYSIDCKSKLKPAAWIDFKFILSFLKGEKSLRDSMLYYLSLVRNLHIINQREPKARGSALVGVLPMPSLVEGEGQGALICTALLGLTGAVQLRSTFKQFQLLWYSIFTHRTSY